MSLRETIKQIRKDQGEDIIQKPIFVGILDDYGAFADELPAVKEIFRKLAQNGYVEKVGKMSSKKKSWTFDMKSIIFDVSSNYGYQNQMIADILKEIAYGLELISKDEDWSDIEESINNVQPTSAPTQGPTAAQPVQPQKKKSLFSFLKFGGGSNEFKISKYVDEKTGFIKPKLDQLSLGAQIQEFENWANSNSVEANYLLGLMYYEGKGVRRDYSRAISYFDIAANAGYSPAQNMMGVCFEQGQGTSSDYDEAAQWYYKAAQQKSPLATKNLGMLYHKRGNDQEALIWLKKATDRNDVESVYLMAEIYYRGAPGIKNDEMALKYYAAASVLHHLQSTYMTGFLISCGYGCDENQELGAHYYKKAANKGHVRSQYKLGCYYWERYRAIPVSYLPKAEDEKKKEEELKNQAYYWLKKASDGGDQDAKKLFKQIYW